MTFTKKLLVAAGFVVAGLAASQNTSLAQPCDPLNPPPGQPYTCLIIDGQKVIVDAYGNPTAGQSQGDAQFLARESSQVPCGTYPVPQTFNVSVKTDLGIITTKLDPTRSSPTASIVANQADKALPATATISVYLEATISTKPNDLYRSERLVTLVNRNTTSFPFVNQVFELTERVRFVNVKNPKDYFTLSDTKVVLSTKK